MKRLKLLLPFILSLLAMALSAPAQTTNTPPPSLWDLVTTGSNYWVVPFGTYAPKDHTTGFGLAVGYKATEFFSPVLRLDDFAHQLYSVSLSAQLQVPKTVMGKIPVIPFGIAGVATPLGGAGGANGSVCGIIGAGAAVKLDFLGSSKFLQHADIVVDYERWTGLPTKQQTQIRFGFLYKF